MNLVGQITYIKDKHGTWKLEIEEVNPNTDADGNAIPGSFLVLAAATLLDESTPKALAKRFHEAHDSHLYKG